MTHRPLNLLADTLADQLHVTHRTGVGFPVLFGVGQNPLEGLERFVRFPRGVGVPELHGVPSLF